jgi:hypothetical protein
MPGRPAIEKSSIIPGMVVVDNSQGIFQLLGLKERYLCLDECYWIRELNH